MAKKKRPASAGEAPIASLGDLTQDPRNARKHNPRNVGLIVDALQEVGAGRSIVIDENGVILAGNATYEAAAEAGINKVVVVQTNGDEIIAVQRRNLTPKQKTRLALFDNRTAETAEWDSDVLEELSSEGLTDGMFREDELEDVFEADKLEDLIGGKLDEDLVDRKSIEDQKRREIRPVLVAADVAIFEEALEATGILDRGEALIEICRSFLRS